MQSKLQKKNPTDLFYLVWEQLLTSKLHFLWIEVQLNALQQDSHLLYLMVLIFINYQSQFQFSKLLKDCFLYLLRF